MKPGLGPFWTIDELGRRTAAALAVGYEGPPNDRVREVPDLRTIRYYTTLGLIDRPAAMRGRTALYGPRHLRQLVAIKRLQARGLSLAEVQRRLVGLTDAGLAQVARVPPAAEADEPPPPGPAAAAAPEPREAAAPARAEAFWREPPAAEPVRARGRAAGPGPGHLALPAEPGAAVALQAITLAPGATLLLMAGPPLKEDDLDAIRKAAGPLIELLHARGRNASRGERTE